MSVPSHPRGDRSPLTILARPMLVFLIGIFAAGSCGKGQETPEGEYEQLRGADLDRAQQLYQEGHAEEGAKMLRALASHSDWAVRSNAIRIMGEVEDPSLLPDLAVALKDDRVEVRESAGRLLVRMGTTEQIPALREAATDEEGIVRGHAGAALARIGGEAEMETVTRLLREDVEPDVRASMAMTLGELGKPEFVPVLIESLADPSEAVRTQAAIALGAIGDPSARTALESARNDPNEFVRMSIEAALKRLEGKQE